MDNKFIFAICLLIVAGTSRSQGVRKVGRLSEVFAWKQLTYNIEGNIVAQDRFADDLEGDNPGARRKRQTDNVFFANEYNEERNWNHRPTTTKPLVTPNEDESGRFFVQYNNVPMGVEKVGKRLFITVPRRRYGIPSTLNYIDLSSTNSRSPPLNPYPNLRLSRSLTSVYRTRADHCGRLWMVDTGMIEIPNNLQQIQPPGIVVFDLNTDRQILRYQFKSTDIPAANTPTGLASITIDEASDCGSTHAYVPDLTTYGLIVYSLRDNDSWRISHSYFHFNPVAGNLNIAGQSFQWSDGIFSMTIKKGGNGCNTAYFHPMVSYNEFAVSACVLNNRTASGDPDYWTLYSIVGERGSSSQSTMHGYHAASNVMLYAEVGRDAVTCWDTARPLTPANVEVLASDSTRLSYPSDLHVIDDEVWVMANSLPRFSYSRLDPAEYNFFVYRAKIPDLISGTICSGLSYNNEPYMYLGK